MDGSFLNTVHPGYFLCNSDLYCFKGQSKVKRRSNQSPAAATDVKKEKRKTKECLTMHASMQLILCSRSLHLSGCWQFLYASVGHHLGSALRLSLSVT